MTDEIERQILEAKANVIQVLAESGKGARRDPSHTVSSVIRDLVHRPLASISKNAAAERTETNRKLVF